MGLACERPVNCRDTGGSGKMQSHLAEIGLGEGGEERGRWEGKQVLNHLESYKLSQGIGAFMGRQIEQLMDVGADLLSQSPSPSSPSLLSSSLPLSFFELLLCARQY